MAEIAMATITLAIIPVPIVIPITILVACILPFIIFQALFL
jgi:hypothetical protein